MAEAESTAEQVRTTMLPGPSAYLRELNHVGIVTQDLEAQLRRLKEIFDVPDTAVTRSENTSVKLAFLTIGDTPYEIIEPLAERTRAILERSGHGVNHVCYAVSDIDAAVAAMAARGVRLGHVTPEGIVDTPEFRMAYFNPDDTAGVLLEFKEFPEPPVG